MTTKSKNKLLKTDITCSSSKVGRLKQEGKNGSPNKLSLKEETSSFINKEEGNRRTTSLKAPNEKQKNRIGPTGVVKNKSTFFSFERVPFS